MNNSDNIISYISRGDKRFLCTLKLESLEELQVLIDNNFMVIDKDYIVVNFAEIGTTVEFKQSIGSLLEPKVVTLQKKVNIVRKTNFFNSTQIKNDLLNLEFDNVIDNQQVMLDYLNNAVMIGSNQGSFSLPKLQNGKALLWQEGALVNSKHDINNTFDKLLSYMENNDHQIVEPPTIEPPVGSKDLFANDIIYNKAILPAKNVEEALHSLCDPVNIFYYNQNIGNKVANVKEALDSISNASGISYDNSKTELEEASNLQIAIESLNSKLMKEINEIKGNLPSQNNQKIIAIPHAIINGSLNNNGQPNHLQYDGVFSLKVVASIDNPLIISFSKDNNLQIDKNVTSRTLKFPSANIIYYVYADLISSGEVIFGYKANKPFYLNYNPTKGNGIHAIDKWQAPSDFFHIPSLTMFDSNNIALNRVYIGQVMFKDNGEVSYMNNYCHGNNYSQDIAINSNNYILNNNLGMDNVIVEVYFKFNKMGLEDKYNYSTNSILIKEDSNRSLRQGYVFRISNSYINLKFPNSSNVSNFYYYFNNTETPSMLSLGYFRVLVKRNF